MSKTLEQLEALAREANEKTRQLSVSRRSAPWWDEETLLRLLDCYDADAAFIAAASPDVILRLVEIAKAAETVASTYEDGYTEAVLWETISSLREALSKT